jgi:hypothetical protein
MSVIEQAFGAVHRLDAPAILRMQRASCRVPTIPFMLCPRARTSEYSQSLDAFKSLTNSLFSAIQAVSRAKVIVDSSKTPSQGYLLSIIPDISLHVIQLVRDSRAVAYSWQRIKNLPEDRGAMVRIGPLQSAMDWNFRHLLVGMLKHANRVRSHIIVKYENFAGNPKEVLSSVLGCTQWAGNPDAIFASTNRVIRKVITHTIEGNPMKFQSGDIVLKPDDEWRRAMKWSDVAVVSAASAPYLMRFGYL